MTPPGNTRGHQVGCDRCARHVAARYSILEQRICNACYSRLRRHPDICPGCAQVKVLAFYDSERRIVCAPCAGEPPRFACITCGSEEQLTGSQCGTCRLAERLHEVLADENGDIHPGLASLYGHLMTARDPRSVVRWLRRPPIGKTLSAMAAGEVQISHDTLDALPPSPRVRYLRHMLISAGTLPEIDVRLNDLEILAEQLIKELPAHHAQIINQYFRWQVLRQTRQRPVDEPLTVGMFNARWSALRKIASFLAWLDEQGVQLETLDQRSVDLFFAHHRSQAAVAIFLNWAIRQKLAGPITPPHRSQARPTPSIPEDTIWRKVDKLLDDESIPPASRIIGLLVLVFAQRISDCVRLRRSDVSEDETALRITFGRTPLALPAPIAELLHHYVIELEAERPFVSGGPDWLFPGTTPHRHVSEGIIRIHLAAHQIQARKAQNARIDQLVQTVPASVVADTLGVNIGTAIRAAARTNSKWGGYPELRKHPYCKTRRGE